MKSFYSRIAALAALLALCLPAGAQRGIRTAPAPLDQLSREAALIVRGHITSARVEPHPQFENLMTVVVTMQIAETLKGPSRKTLQFRQYIWDMRERLDAARYAKGQELLLLLGPVSPYGLRSPVGLDQGRFRIVRDHQGEAMAVNGAGNNGLFVTVAQHAQARGLQLSPRARTLVNGASRGPVPLAALTDAIRVLGNTE